MQPFCPDPQPLLNAPEVLRTCVQEEKGGWASDEMDLVTPVGESTPLIPTVLPTLALTPEQ